MDIATLFYALAIVLMLAWLVFLLCLIVMLVVVYKKIKLAQHGVNQKLLGFAENTLAKTAMMSLLIPLAKYLFTHMASKREKA